MKRLALLLVAAAGGLTAQTAFTVSTSSLSFGNILAGTTASRTFTIQTLATPSLRFNLASTNPTVFVVNPSTFEGAPGPAATVTINFNPQLVGPQTGTINIVAFTPTGLLAGNASVVVSGAGGAAFSVSSAPLSFGTVLMGCSGAQTLGLTANTPLAFTVESTNPAFVVSETDRSFTLEGSRAITVLFRPAVAGTLSGLISILTPMGGRSVSITGTGVDIVPTPPTLDFGNVRLGSTSGRRPVRLAPDPPIEFPLQYTISTSDLAFASSPVSPSGVAEITFTPPAEGSFLGMMVYVITRWDPQEQNTCVVSRVLGVRGTGTRLEVGISPGSLDFGQVEVGSTSSERTITVTNNTTLEFTGTAESSGSQFPVSPTAFTVAAGSSQAFNVTFRPTATGSATGSVTFNLESSGPAAVRSTLTVQLAGAGQPTAAITVNPERLDFGDAAVGAEVSRTVTVVNSSRSQASVAGATSSPAFAVSPASFTLAVGASRVVTIAFTPAAAGSAQASATFTVGTTRRTVTLSGRGVAATMSFAVATGQGTTPVPAGGSLQLPETNVGSSSTLQFQISNTGSVAASVSRIASSGAGFNLVGLPSLPASVAPASSLSFAVSFQPEAPGLVSGALTVDGQTFALRGTGLVSGAVLSVPDSVSAVQQPAIAVALPQSYRVAVTGRLSFTFTSDSAVAGDPAAQFPAGGRTVDFTIPANSTQPFSVPFQTGTVAGTFQFRATLEVAGASVLAAPLARAVTLSRQPPIISQVAIESRAGSSLTLAVTLHSTTGRVNQLTLSFEGSNLATPSLTADVGALFGNWYQSPAAGPFGSAAILRLPLTVQGNWSDIRSIAVTLSNEVGASQTARISP